MLVIFASVNHIATQLNQYLKNRFELSEDIVIVSNLINHDGAIEANTNNKVVVFLANLEKDTMPQRQTRSFNSPDGRHLVTSKPLYLNLSLVITANFTGANYLEALKFISHIVSYFQLNPIFDHQNSPELSPGIEKLILNIENIQRHDLSSMWGMFGAKYLPSIIYKVRMVTMGSQAITSQVSTVQQPSLNIERN